MQDIEGHGSIWEEAGMMLEVIRDFGIFQFLVLVFMMGVGWQKLSRLDESVRRIEGKLNNGISERVSRIEQRIEDVVMRGCGAKDEVVRGYEMGKER